MNGRRGRGIGGELSPATASTGMEPATLLLVEDDPVIRTFLADNLTADGYELLVADPLRDALRVLELQRPDLAVVDLALPDGSGLELIRRIRGADGIVSHLDPA